MDKKRTPQVGDVWRWTGCQDKSIAGQERTVTGVYRHGDVAGWSTREDCNGRALTFSQEDIDDGSIVFVRAAEPTR